jgi:hypothetical protein
MTRRKALLNRLLQILVDEWGHDVVAGALTRIVSSPNNGVKERTPGLKHGREKKRKPSATEQIERNAAQGEQKEALLQLAVLYDRKLFLPSVADVREFLVMMGGRPGGIKDRNKAFRVLLRSLMELPVERLQELARTALHSGPSELGPLSDAISAAGERLPRQRQANTD